MKDTLIEIIKQNMQLYPNKQFKEIVYISTRKQRYTKKKIKNNRKFTKKRNL